MDLISAFQAVIVNVIKNKTIEKKAAKVNTFTNMIYFMLFFVRRIKLRLPE